MSKQSSASISRRLTKSLFEAGLQCAKRLYLEYHHPDRTPPLPPSREEMSATGRRLVEIARTAFPKGVEIPFDDDEKALAATAEALKEPAPQVLFDAALAHDGVQVRCDILIRDKSGVVDVFEVKSGIKVKPRYVQDLALQSYVLEGNGLKVRSAVVVHLNPRYRWEGGDHHVHTLFQNTDVTEKVLQQISHTRELAQGFRELVEDEGALELPTGTWCTNPFPCPHLPHCAKEEPDMPLRLLPELTREQEREFHEAGIESLAQIDPQRPGLTLRQRRTLQALDRDELQVDLLVRTELAELEFPVHFVAVQGALDVLPRYTGTRPWRTTPFCWSVHTLDADGSVEHACFAAESDEDPREEALTALADQVGAGTLLVHSQTEIEQLRPLMDDVPQAKKAIRTVLNAPRVVTEPLLASGVFHPSIAGRTDLDSYVEALVPDRTEEDLAIGDREQAIAAFRRIQTPRTRATTRKRLAGELRDFVTRRSAGLMELYRHLTSEAGD